MRKTRAAQADSERLLSGDIPDDERLARLKPHVDALGRIGRRVPTEAQVEGFAAAAARAVSAGERRVVGVSTRRSTYSPRRPRLALRLAGAAAALVVVLCASTGVAYAADHAVPGDTLYRLDRALETIGLGDGGLRERLTEASELVERDRTQEALNLAGEAIAAEPDQSEALRMAVEALRRAADAAPGAASAQTPDVQALAAEKLRWLATAAPTGDEFVQAIYDLADSISPQGQGGTGDEPDDAIDQAQPGSGGGGSGGGGGTNPTGYPGGSGPRN